MVDGVRIRRKYEAETYCAWSRSTTICMMLSISDYDANGVDERWSD
jgi:hypothetical protein